MVNYYVLSVGIGAGSEYTAMPPPDYSRWSGGDIAFTILGLVFVIAVLMYVYSIITKRRYKK